jgi:hypothetical protein
MAEYPFLVAGYHGAVSGCVHGQFALEVLTDPLAIHTMLLEEPSLDPPEPETVELVRANRLICG